VAGSDVAKVRSCGLTPDVDGASTDPEKSAVAWLTLDVKGTRI